VVHAASIAVAANDRRKMDKRDSLKMAHQRAAGRLKGIRVPSVEQEQERLPTRTGEQLMRAKRRAQVQIQMRPHQFGLFPTHIERVIRLKDVDALREKMEGDLHYTVSCLCAESERLAVQVKEIDRKLLERSRSKARLTRFIGAFLELGRS
jgi:hypothetical protein